MPERDIESLGMLGGWRRPGNSSAVVVVAHLRPLALGPLPNGATGAMGPGPDGAVGNGAPAQFS